MTMMMALLAFGAEGMVKNPLHVSEWKRHPAQVVDSALVEFTISVKQSSLEALYDKALAVSTPGNPSYGKYLTAGAIERLTAPSPMDMRTVIAWLTEYGIEYTHDKHMLHISTTVGSAARLLRTDFSMYTRSSDSRMILRALWVFCASVGSHSDM